MQKSNSRIDIIAQNGNDGIHYEKLHQNVNQESDPNGKNPHEGGAKLDSGKNRMGLVLNGFALALLEVGKVGTYGANKYTDNGWEEVENGEARYTDAMLRHHFEEAAYLGDPNDKDTKLSHLAHRAWNALATLEKHLRETKDAENLLNAGAELYNE